jgi:hypothetical protein
MDTECGHTAGSDDENSDNFRGAGAAGQPCDFIVDCLPGHNNVKDCCNKTRCG